MSEAPLLDRLERAIRLGEMTGAAGRAPSNIYVLAKEASASLRHLLQAATAVVEDFPIAAGTARLVAQDGGGYGSILALRHALQAAGAPIHSPTPQTDPEGEE